jgi:hypothetical protein
MSDPFKSERYSRDMPAIGGFAVTTHNTNDLPTPIRAVTINGGGTLSFISSIDGATYTTSVLPPGTYALHARRIRTTGTSATEITGWI